MKCAHDCYRRSGCRRAMQEVLLARGRALKVPAINEVSLLGLPASVEPGTLPLCPSAARRIPNALLAIDQVWGRICLVELSYPTADIFIES